MNYSAARCEIRFGFVAPKGTLRNRYVDFHIATDRQIEARHKRRAAPTKIFAGSFFLKNHSAAVPSAHRQR
jgi:hypothetical protein